MISLIKIETGTMIKIHVEKWKDHYNKIHTQRNDASIPHSLKDDMIHTFNIRYTYYDNIIYEDRKWFDKEIHTFQRTTIQHISI